MHLCLDLLLYLVICIVKQTLFPILFLYICWLSLLHFFTLYTFSFAGHLFLESVGSMLDGNYILLEELASILQFLRRCSIHFPFVSFKLSFYVRFVPFLSFQLFSFSFHVVFHCPKTHKPLPPTFARRNVRKRSAAPLVGEHGVPDGQTRFLQCFAKA